MDMLFGLLLLGVVSFVAWVGCLAYEEGLKIEASKRHGEAWLQWLGEASTQRFQTGFEPAACAGQSTPVTRPAEATNAASASASGNVWGGCFKALTQTGGAWAKHLNAFSAGQILLVPKCDKTDRTVAGHFLIEKLSPTPPGSPLPVVASVLTESEPLDAKVMLRLTLCDKGGDQIRVGEVEF